MAAEHDLQAYVTMDVPDEEYQAETTAGLNPSAKANSESILISPLTRTSLPIIVSWWKNYHKDVVPGIESDDSGVYQCIKQQQSPPSDEIELSISVENSFENTTYPNFHAKISRNALKHSILEIVKSTNYSNLNFLEDIENGTMTVENAEQIFNTCTRTERNVVLLWTTLNMKADLLETLFKYEIDIHFSEPMQGFTALHLSAFNDSVECTKFLISQGADVNFTPDKYTPLETACFHNSYRVAKLLLENGAKANVEKEGAYCGTPLHSAVKSNAIECVQLLLAEGADRDSTKAGGMSPLHIAAEMGHLHCLKILLDGGVDANFNPPDSKNTALHLAAEGGFSECVSLLLSKGANADIRNFKGQTALHLAARIQSIECVEVLLKRDRNCANAKDNDRRTPLHSAVGKNLNASEITELLIKAGAHVNEADIYGYTPLHVAALNENSQCVQILINHGADVSMRTKGGNSALGIIVRKTPLALSVLYKKLDGAIRVHDPEVSSSKEVIMKLDFRVFLQRCQKGEMNFLKTFLDEGQKEILEHPLCKAFLHIKWEKIRKYYIGRMIFYGLLVLSLTAYIFTTFIYDCYKDSEKLGGPKYVSNSSNASRCDNTTVSGFLNSNPVFMKIEWFSLMFFVICETIRKTYAMIGCSNLHNYVCHIDNIIEWFVLIGSFLISYLFSNVSQWQNHVAAFTVLFAWINVMLLIGQLPVLGSYVAMYIKVQKEFLKLFIAYACLLIGFTLAFCVIFPKTDIFQNPAFGFIQVIALMIGSVEYEDLVFEEDKKGFVLTISAHLVFLLFMLFVTIIMMNLLVGIAVRDIQGLQKTAGLSKLVRQTKLISSIELSLFNNWLPKYMLMVIRHTALISPSGYRVVLHVKPLNHREKRLPKDILRAAYDIAKVSKSNYSTSPSVTSRLFSFIGKRENSTAQLIPDELTQLQKLQKEVENGNLAIAVLTEEIQELKSLLRNIKH
ncbi:transient receptor potential channel pyrexia-like [Periplaneta americana]|uniref:transient receptor potential channel pyrexia-like n=1 Tax=Periplaneta americana TaxID=6978 RepID=UPI0037E826BE